MLQLILHYVDSFFSSLFSKEKHVKNKYLMFACQQRQSSINKRKEEKKPVDEMNWNSFFSSLSLIRFLEIFFFFFASTWRKKKKELLKQQLITEREKKVLCQQEIRFNVSGCFLENNTSNVIDSLIGFNHFLGLSQQRQGIKLIFQV